MGDNKDENYNDPIKKEEQPGGLLAPRQNCFCFPAVPGDQYQSTIVCTKCPHCNAVGATEGEAFWSVKSYLCCYYCGICWWCWQSVKGKDWIIKDVNHKCSSCKQTIQEYKSC